MVFENLTLFEIQLDGSQFGPRSMNRDDQHEDHHADHDEAADEGGRGRLFPVVLLALVAIGAGMLYRRSRSSDVEFDADAEAEDAEADLATSQ